MEAGTGDEQREEERLWREVSDGGGREILTKNPGQQMEGERQRFETKNKDLD